MPAQGASISVQAGVGNASPAQYAAFISTYIDNSSQFDSSLISYVESIDNLTGLTAAQAKQVFNAMSPGLQRTYVEELFFELLQYYGSKEAASGNGDFSGAFAAISKLFPGANPAAGQTNPYQGNIDLYFSQIYTEQGGNISLLAPGGEIDAGLALAPASFGINKLPDQLGIVAATTGDVSTFTYGDLQIDQSRLFAADGGDITVWSTDGNIDAGAGAKTSISAPEVNIVYDSNGQPTTSLRAAIAGSGIEALAATPGVSPGNVYLFAPRGVVNAGDAGIVAGNLTVAATAVIGANNITVSGTSVGVPSRPPRSARASPGLPRRPGRPRMRRRISTPRLRPRATPRWPMRPSAGSTSSSPDSARRTASRTTWSASSTKPRRRGRNERARHVRPWGDRHAGTRRLSITGCNKTITHRRHNARTKLRHFRSRRKA